MEATKVRKIRNTCVLVQETSSKLYPRVFQELTAESPVLLVLLFAKSWNNWEGSRKMEENVCCVNI